MVNPRTAQPGVHGISAAAERRLKPNPSLDCRLSLKLKHTMQRVVVIGCSGAGKSAFARELRRLLGIRLYHLDELLWRKPGACLDRHDWLRVQEEIADGPSWIMEGNYGGTIDARLRRADTVIFLDYSAASCLAGLLKRILLSRLGIEKRGTVVRGCNDRFTLRLLREAVSFRRKHRRGILSGIARFPSIRLIHLRNRRETVAFLESCRGELSSHHPKEGPTV